MKIELIGGLIAILVFIAKLFDYYSRKRQSSEMRDVNLKLNAICLIVTKTWEIHDKYDDDGSPKWYLPKSKMNEISQQLNKILEEIRMKEK